VARGIKNESYSDENQEVDIQEFRDKLLVCLEGMEEPRVSDNQNYTFMSIMGIILCAIIAGANSISDVAHYAKAKFEWLSKWLDLPNGPPQYGVFWWMLVRLEPLQSERLFRSWIAELVSSEFKEIIAIDGKRVRGASKKKNSQSFLHMVSAWSSSRGLILGQIKTEEKSNEITAIPELIESLDITGAVITIDAMGCQKSIAQKIIDKRGDYFFALKGNQESIHDEVANFFEQAQAINFEGVDHDFHHTAENGHGRLEEREVYVVKDIDWLPLKNDWAELKSIVMVVSHRSLEGTHSTEARYYLSSLDLDAERAARSIRAHWGIENKVHWVLDVVFEEDDSQISTGHAAENFSILRRLALNIIRLDKDDKTSLKAKRKKAGWSDSYMEHLLGVATIKSF